MVKTYGLEDYDYVGSISQTSDGGYVVAGYNGDILVIKLDSSGNIQWAKTYGSTGDDLAYSVSPTSDGGYIVAGATNSYSGSSYYYYFLILKLNSSGDSQWGKTYYKTRSDPYDYGQSIAQASDGGYIVAGYTSGYLF